LVFDNLRQHKKMELKQLQRNQIRVDESLNPREVYDVEPLKNDILTNGMNTPLFVSLQGKTYSLLRGYRRMRVIKGLSKSEYEKLFPNGIPCQIFDGLTASQEQMLRLDHSNSKPLETDLEIFRTVKFYMQCGKKEREIALLMDGFFANRIKSSAIPKRNAALKLKSQEEKSKALLSVWKGRLEPFTRATHLPDDIMDIFEKSLSLDSDVPEVDRLTKQDVKALYSAWVKDENDPSTPTPTKKTVGVNYRDKLEEIKQSKLSSVDETPKVKMQTKEDIKKYRSQFESDFAHRLFAWILGESVSGLVETDRIISAYEETLKETPKETSKKTTKK
jgi:hypothetical protein